MNGPRRVELSTRDRYGRTHTSCVVVDDERSQAERDAHVRQQRADRDNEVDLQVIKAIAKHQSAATSLEFIQKVVGIRKADVTAAMRRLIDHRHVAPGKRGQPYTVTSQGWSVLNRGTVPNSSEEP